MNIRLFDWWINRLIRFANQELVGLDRFELGLFDQRINRLIRFANHKLVGLDRPIR